MIAVVPPGFACLCIRVFVDVMEVLEKMKHLQTSCNHALYKLLLDDVLFLLSTAHMDMSASHRHSAWVSLNFAYALADE